MSVSTNITQIHKPKPKYKVLNEITKRWSPRFFSEQHVPSDDLNKIFEAARWAPSGHNQQPWYFFYTKKGSEAYKKLFSTLEEYNKTWANTAPVLIIACAIKDNEIRENPFAFYDLGASVLSLILQAQHLGYYSRQMGLFDKEKVKEIFTLSQELQPFVIIAIGKIGNFNSAPKQIIEYELDPRPRKTDFVKELGM